MKQVTGVRKNSLRKCNIVPCVLKPLGAVFTTVLRGLRSSGKWRCVSGSVPISSRVDKFYRCLKVMVLRPVKTAGSDYPLTQSHYPIRTEFLAVPL